MLERGSQQQVGIAADRPFNSYYSGNTIQICPVGALTSAMYRFRSRPFDLVSTPTACEHCASGCSQRTDTRRNSIMRRLAAVDPEVNEEWNCDKGRFAFRYVDADRPADRRPWSARTASCVRRRGLRPWTLRQRGLRAAAGTGGVIAGGRLHVEDAYAYSTFARVRLGTNNVDFRARPASSEEEQFLALTSLAAGSGRPTPTLSRPRPCSLVAFEPEDESPIVLLRLRKAPVRTAPKCSPSLLLQLSVSTKVAGTWLPAAPGQEAALA